MIVLNNYASTLSTGLKLSTCVNNVLVQHVQWILLKRGEGYRIPKMWYGGCNPLPVTHEQSHPLRFTLAQTLALGW